MSCPAETTVTQFLSGRLDESERRRVLTHLADCVPCCRLFGALVTNTLTPEAAAKGDDRPRSDVAPALDSPEERDRLSHYRIDEPIGFGGMGVVYSAYDPRLDRQVALKVLWAPSAGNDADVLQREARAMAKLAHPNVVRVFDVGLDRGRMFVAMELVEGETMRAWLQRGPHPWRDVLARFRQAGEGLAAAHRAGLVHRDFKPDNLLVRADGTVLVTDFGLAREVPLGHAVTTRPRLDESEGGTDKGGTPVYMAPEQLRGEVLDARADVYAFSVALWEGLFGRRPFAFDTVKGLLERIAEGPDDPKDVPGLPEVPARIRRALLRGMAARRRDRHASVEALLAACGVDESSRSWRASAARAAIAAAVVALLFAGGIVVGRRSPDVPRVSAFDPQVAPSGDPERDTVVLSSAAAPRESATALPAEDAASEAHAAPSASAASIAVATAGTAPGTAPLASRTTRLRRGALRGTNFGPFGAAGADARDTVQRHEVDFEPCLRDACVKVTCRLSIDLTGIVSRAVCASWEGEPPCTATQACLEKKLRTLQFPTTEREGESTLHFSEW